MHVCHCVEGANKFGRCTINRFFFNVQVLDCQKSELVGQKNIETREARKKAYKEKIK